MVYSLLSCFINIFCTIIFLKLTFRIIFSSLSYFTNQTSYQLYLFHSRTIFRVFSILFGVLKFFYGGGCLLEKLPAPIIIFMNLSIFFYSFIVFFIECIWPVIFHGEFWLPLLPCNPFG